MQELFKRICPICGKEFYSYDSDAWVYRIGDSKHADRGKYIRVCSWTCMRKWEREHDKQRKKRVLNSYRRIVQQERAIRDEIDSLTLLHSPSLDGMPHGASDPRGLDAFWAKAGALFEKWQTLLDKKYAALSVITDEIEKLPNETEKTLLMLRYINGKTFEQVAVEMGYSWRHTLRLHGQALAHFMEGTDDG